MNPKESQIIYLFKNNHKMSEIKKLFKCSRQYISLVINTHLTKEEIEHIKKETKQKTINVLRDIYIKQIEFRIDQGMNQKDILKELELPMRDYVKIKNYISPEHQIKMKENFKEHTSKRVTIYDSDFYKELNELYKDHNKYYLSNHFGINQTMMNVLIVKGQRKGLVIRKRADYSNRGKKRNVNS